ncbi:hypothetical protein J2Z19_002559 [Ensifer adhaerens]|uniref:Uncharacterized protein n=1 Tax=Ensifer adhaerens TaxID=106592 RepID=A0ACC5SVE8_ENSAD|nr:hypothetical protein [Ensifer adhaerens]MBP1872847.1 hypothetical protein [Ensifer adhaerens]
MKPLSHFFSVIDAASGADDQPAIAAEFARISETTGRIAALVAAYERLSTKGAHRTFRATGEVGPLPAASPAKTGA